MPRESPHTRLHIGWVEPHYIVINDQLYVLSKATHSTRRYKTIDTKHAVIFWLFRPEITGRPQRASTLCGGVVRSFVLITVLFDLDVGTYSCLEVTPHQIT